MTQYQLAAIVAALLAIATPGWGGHAMGVLATCFLLMASREARNGSPSHRSG